MDPMEHIATITDGFGNSITLPLIFDGDRQYSQINIDGVPYHIERIPKSLLMSTYTVDADPDYQPQTDDKGYCYIIAPFLA